MEGTVPEMANLAEIVDLTEDTGSSAQDGGGKVPKKKYVPLRRRSPIYAYFDFSMKGKSQIPTYTCKACK
jgi:hypothetical protein